ncbi:MAG: hypothetical protein ACREMX_00975 [Gemmatimonadales bacterium]
MNEEELDRSLRGISFRPRASLGPEVLGRLRRGERSKSAVAPRRRRPGLAGLAAGLFLAAGTVLALRGPPSVVVDRCCYDLDGGGDADDGVLIHAERDARVHRLQVYEDRDGSRSYSATDLIRLDRGNQPSMQGPPGQGLVTIERCCLDFDGGGPDDDGLLVIGVPPDRVVMAAIYETGEAGRPWPARRPPRWTLR